IRRPFRYVPLVLPRSIRWCSWPTWRIIACRRETSRSYRTMSQLALRPIVVVPAASNAAISGRPTGVPGASRTRRGGADGAGGAGSGGSSADTTGDTTGASGRDRDGGVAGAVWAGAVWAGGKGWVAGAVWAGGKGWVAGAVWAGGNGSVAGAVCAVGSGWVAGAGCSTGGSSWVGA